MSTNSHEWLLGLHTGFTVTQDWLDGHYVPSVRALMKEREKLLAVVDAVEKHAGMGTLPDEIEDALAALSALEVEE